MNCPTCGFENRPNASFCQKCGQPLRAASTPSPPPATCHACGAAAKPASRFCRQCGEPLQAAPAPPSPSPVPSYLTDATSDRKLALVIGTSEYEDPRLTRLATPGADVDRLVEILQDPEVGGFDQVTPLVNQSADTIRLAIARFFAGKKRDNLLLLYFSGHGVRDDRGDLYLAMKNTEHDLLSATAIPAAFVTSEMNRSRSRRQVLILDCCHSGAFARGAKGAPGASVGTAAAFEGTGYGRVVLTATDSTQYAWEGDQVIGEADTSVFTRYLIQGLQSGEADSDADGWITLDDLYEYVYAKVVTETPKQTPGKWSYKQQGDIIIARNPHPVEESTGRLAAEKAARKQAARQVARLLQQLSRAESHGDWDEVINLGERILKLDADHQLAHSRTAAAYAVRGEGHKEAQDHGRAIADLGRAIQLDPSEAEYYYQRGLSYVAQEDPNSALADFNRAIQLDPDHVDCHFQRGRCHADMGDPEVAIADFSRAIELAPNQADYYTQRGCSHADMGNPDEAFADFERAIELDPDGAAPYLHRGAIHFLMGNHDQAIADLDRAIQADPAEVTPTHYFCLGASYNFTGEYDRAIAHLSRAIELEPNQGTYYGTRGASYLARDKPDDDASDDFKHAVEDLTRAIELDPDEGSYHYLRAVCRFRLDDQEQGTADLERAIELGDADAYALRGSIHLEAGDYDAAIADLTQAIQIDPEDVSYYSQRIAAYFQRGDHDQVIADCTRAIELDPGADEYYAMRGTIHFQRDDYEQAIADMTQAIELDPDQGHYYHLRGMAYRLVDRGGLLFRGDKKAAKRDLERAAELGYEDADATMKKWWWRMPLLK